VDQPRNWNRRSDSVVEGEQTQKHLVFRAERPFLIFSPPNIQDDDDDDDDDTYVLEIRK
jgi:hypothetical protein